MTASTGVEDGGTGPATYSRNPRRPPRKYHRRFGPRIDNIARAASEQSFQDLEDRGRIEMPVPGAPPRTPSARSIENPAAVSPRRPSETKPQRIYHT